MNILNTPWRLETAQVHVTNQGGGGNSKCPFFFSFGPFGFNLVMFRSECRPQEFENAFAGYRFYVLTHGSYMYVGDRSPYPNYLRPGNYMYLCAKGQSLWYLVGSEDLTGGYNIRVSGGQLRTDNCQLETGHSAGLPSLFRVKNNNFSTLSPE